MAIHSLCIVKNEADIIEQTLRAALQWSDWIYVFDDGSDDGTWELVQALACESPGIVPWKREPIPFTDRLRGEIFQEFKERGAVGDWWCILDADEFYIDDPRAFLAAVPQHYKAVWPQLYTYLFTEKEAAEYQDEPRRFGVDSPICEQLHHYVLGKYSELRFFRHDPRLVGLPPPDVGRIYPKRIRMRHFGYRSPDQIMLRLATRREPMLRGEFIHEKRSNWQPGGSSAPGPAREEDFSTSWKERIADSAECYYDSGDNSLVAPLPWTPPVGSVGARVRKTRRALKQTARRAAHWLSHRNVAPQR